VFRSTCVSCNSLSKTDCLGVPVCSYHLFVSVCVCMCHCITHLSACVSVARLLLYCVWSPTGKNFKRCCMARRVVSNIIVSWPIFAQQPSAATQHLRATTHHVLCCSYPSHRCHLEVTLDSAVETVQLDCCCC